MDEFTRAYVEAMIWSSTDDEGNPLDYQVTPDDLAPQARNQIEVDCKRFQELAAKELDGEDLSQAGHDFWLTRNGHGAGFWDGDWPEPAATRLAELAREFGEANPYVGDDGLIYLYPG
jgi:hypothetical protein